VDSYQEALMRRQPKSQEAKAQLAPAIQQAENDVVPQEQRTASDAPLETGGVAQYQTRNALKEQQLQRVQDKNPELFNELKRRRTGKTPFNSLDTPTDNGVPNTNFAQGREQRRQEELQWRNETAANNEGVLGSLRSFASNKWHSFAHGSETDQVQSQRSSFGRERQNDSDWARGTTKDATLKDTQQQNVIEPVKTEGGWHLPFFSGSRSGELHHMAHGWTGKQNTRLIDSLTDDELSMMSL
jgi:hypothetical protein